jgi:hypothetical protein
MAHQPRLREPPPRPQQLEPWTQLPRHVPHIRRLRQNQRRALKQLVDVTPRPLVLACVRVKSRGSLLGIASIIILFCFWRALIGALYSVCYYHLY